MSRMSILNAPGQQTEGFCMVKSAALRTDSKGGAYMDMVLADAGGECVAKIWNYGPSMGMFEPEDIVKVRGTVTIWKDSEQLKIERIRQATEADQVDMSKIVPCSPQDPDAAYEILWRETEAFKDQDLKRLVQYLMKEHKREMLYYPAAVKLHHATRGGFLEHTLNIVSLGKAVAARYDHLDGELIVAGAILHDIGKLTELDTGKLGVASAYSWATSTSAWPRSALRRSSCRSPKKRRSCWSICSSPTTASRSSGPPSSPCSRRRRSSPPWIGWTPSSSRCSRPWTAW